MTTQRLARRRLALNLETLRALELGPLSEDAGKSARCKNSYGRCVDAA